MSKYEASKAIVCNYFEAMENASPETVADVLKEFTAKDYQGIHKRLNNMVIRACVI